MVEEVSYGVVEEVSYEMVRETSYAMATLETGAISHLFHRDH